MGGGTLVTGADEADVCRDNNKNSDVWGDPAPALGKVMSYRMDMAARVAADDA